MKGMWSIDEIYRKNNINTDVSFCRKFKIIEGIPGFVAAFYRVKSGKSGVQR